MQGKGVMGSASQNECPSLSCLFHPISFVTLLLANEEAHVGGSCLERSKMRAEQLVGRGESNRPSLAAGTG